MKLILFVNIKITDFDINGKFIKKEINNFDIFLFSLRSYINIKFDKVYLHVEIDKHYINRFNEIEDILKSFNCQYSFIKVRIYELVEYTNISIYFLQKNYDFIMYLGNHDHVYVADKFFDFKKYIIESFNRNINHIDSIYVSHFPEIISRKTNYFHINTPSKIVSENRFGTIICWKNFDAVQVFSVSAFLNFWCKQKYDGLFVGNDFNNDTKGWVRSDDPRFANRIILKKINTLIPNHEFLRHFDGYGHAGIPGFKLDKFFINNWWKMCNINRYYNILDIVDNNNRFNRINRLKFYRQFNPRVIIFDKDFFTYKNVIKLFSIFFFDVHIFLKVNTLVIIKKILITLNKRTYN